MASPRPGRSRAMALAAASVLLVALAACAPENGSASGPGASASQGETPDPSGSPSASPSSSATAQAEIPQDCEEMLSEDVLAELEDVPLNHPAFGPAGYIEGKGLTCTWADPAADTTHLTTALVYMSRGPALDMLNGLADTEGFTCYTPDDGTRCEKTWANETYPVMDGRTLYWRDGILIDTQYSNLAPSGFTASIVEHIWPD